MKYYSTVFILLLISISSISVGQIFTTTMKLTIRDEFGNTVDSASVKIFEKKEDYLKEVNVTAEAMTNAKGVVKFKNLKPVTYFLLVRKKDKNNFGEKEEIGKLSKGKINKSTVIIQ